MTHTTAYSARPRLGTATASPRPFSLADMLTDAKKIAEANRPMNLGRVGGKPNQTSTDATRKGGAKGGRKQTDSARAWHQTRDAIRAYPDRTRKFYADMLGVNESNISDHIKLMRVAGVTLAVTTGRRYKYRLIE